MTRSVLSRALGTDPAVPVLTRFPGGQFAGGQFSGGRYSVACGSCGTRLRLTDEDLELGRDEHPICWPCDTRSGPEH